MTQEQNDRLFIIGVEVHNFKRIDLVKIVPHETGVTIIGGENAQGKSSLLDAAVSALAGAKSIPDRPLREGTREGRAIVDLSNGLVVERTFNTTKKGGDLFVRTKDGATFKSPQSVLDDPFGGIGFDPVKFIDVNNPKEEREQMQQLRDALGLDFTKLDADKEKAFSERKMINSEIKKLEGKLATITRYDDAPDAEVSISELTKEYNAANENNREIVKLEDKISDCKDEIDELKSEIKILQDKLRKRESSLDDFSTALERMSHIDLEGIESKMSSIEDDNRKVRANADYEATQNEIAEKTEISERLTNDLKSIDAEKRQMVENANIPVDGLEFGEEGLIYNGVPLKQASSAEQIKVAIALADILNPKSRVILIRQGSSLDHKMLKQIAEMADARGLQVIMERVSTGNEDLDRQEFDYIIEDGRVKE